MTTNLLTIHIYSLFTLIDGTLNRLIPNLEAIRKVNHLHNEGWCIDITYYDNLTHDDVYSMLINNGVLFHGVSTTRAGWIISPMTGNTESFITTPVQSKPSLNTDALMKVGKWGTFKDLNPNATALWYYAASGRFMVPEVLHVGVNVITRQHLVKTGDTDIEACKLIAQLFADLPAINGYDWGHYCKAVKHCLNGINCNEEDYKALTTVYGRLMDIQEPPPNTFSHGSMSTDNVVIITKQRHKMAKPKETYYLVNPDNTTYSSYLLDLHRLEAWLAVDYTKRLGVNETISMPILTIAECLRIYSQLPKEVAEDLLRIIVLNL